MTPSEDEPREYYIDIRYQPTSEKISLDLSRHLPRRAAVGPVAVIAERPLVLLSVIKKRWTRVIQEVERQYASTLDRAKKEILRQELERLRTYRFGANSLGKPIDILFVASDQLLPHAVFPTIYVTVPVASVRLTSISYRLAEDGVLVVYSDDEQDTTKILAILRDVSGIHP